MSDNTNNLDNIDKAIKMLTDMQALEVEFEGVWKEGTPDETDVNGNIWVIPIGDYQWHTEIWAPDWTSDYAPILPSPEANCGSDLAKALHDNGYRITAFWNAENGKPDNI